MKIEKLQYIGIKDDVKIYSKEYMNPNKMEEFEKHIINKVENFNPTIMVYGVYNAGKSTLLNALFGKVEMAKTGDSPETSNIYDYSYNGYTIYDTPGINAPQEHEDVTQEHRAKCEVILFVISNDGSFEDEYVYEKISEIIKEKKPLLIVLNNKSGIDIRSAEASAEIDKVNFHLSTICDRKGIDKAEENVSVIFVDALMALEGKTENESEFIDESNILHLENKIDELLGASGNTEVTNALNLYIRDYIESTIDIIDSKIDNPEMKKTQKLITYLEKLKQKTEIELKNVAMESVAIASANLLELLLSKDKNSIEAMIQKTTNDVMGKINTKIKQIHDEINSKIDKFKVDFEELNVALNKITPSDEITEKLINQNSNKSLNAVGGTLIMSIPSTLIIPGPLPIPVKALASVALAIYNIFAGSNQARIKAEAKLDAKRQQHLSAKNKSEEFSIEYGDTVMEGIETSINNTFSKIIADFMSFSNKLDGENIKLLEDKENLQSILNRI